MNAVSFQRRPPAADPIRQRACSVNSHASTVGQSFFLSPVTSLIVSKRNRRGQVRLPLGCVPRLFCSVFSSTMWLCDVWYRRKCSAPDHSPAFRPVVRGFVLISRHLFVVLIYATPGDQASVRRQMSGLRSVSDIYLNMSTIRFSYPSHSSWLDSTWPVQRCRKWVDLAGAQWCAAG